MEFEFWGEAIAYADIDPSEYVGMSREDIAECLREHSLDWTETHFDDDQFLEAADRVLSELGRG